MNMTKTLLFTALVAGCLFTANSRAESEEFTKTKIAVLDFRMQGAGLDDDMGKIVAEWLITALVKDGRFDVVERRLLESIIDEHKLVMSGVVDANNAEELGQLLGVKVIITGSLMKFQNVMEANARIIDVKNASIIAAESVQSSNAIKLEDLVKQMAEKIIRDFPLEGYVVRCNAETVTLDLGHQSGVKPGMQFSVYQEGQIIKHPRTGEVLDIERVQSAVVEIKTVRKNISIAKILSRNEGMEVSYGQHVSSIKEEESELPPASFPSSTPPVASPKVALAHSGPSADVIAANPLYVRITSNNSATKIRAVKEVAKKRYVDETTLDVLESELLKGYQIKDRDGYHVDALAWCCKILGLSGNSKYEATLHTVSMGSTSPKLQAYAQKGLAYMARKRR